MPKVKRAPAAYIGIDPGKNGGLAIISSSNPVTVSRMPETERDVWEWFCGIEDGGPVAVIEYINPGFQGTGKSSMAKLYGSYMALRMGLTAAEIPFDIATTAKWARALGVPPRTKSESRTQWKNRLKGRAQQLYPRENVTLATCDALLIATYCKRLHGGTL